MRRVLEILDPFAILFGYWVVAALVVWFLHRQWGCSPRRADNPRRYSFCFALVIAIVFTPSLVGDFWLWVLPGPAVLGFLWFLPAVVTYPKLIPFELTYYVLPMALVFGITYAVLRRRDRHLFATQTV
jgi:hypothetical protein